MCISVCRACESMCVHCISKYACVRVACVQELIRTCAIVGVYIVGKRAYLNVPCEHANACGVRVGILNAARTYTCMCMWRVCWVHPHMRTCAYLQACGVRAGTRTCISMYVLHACRSVRAHTSNSSVIVKRYEWGGGGKRSALRYADMRRPQRYRVRVKNFDCGAALFLNDP